MKANEVIKKIAKWTAITVASFAAIIVIVLSICLWILTPEKLTPMVRDAAADALPGVEVKLNRAELTFWSTFPRLYIHLDSLAINNPDFPLPEGREIINVNRLDGGVDLIAIIKGNFSIYDVELAGSRLKFIALNDSLSNITPLLTADTDTTSSSFDLQEIAINRFDIVDSLVVNYRAVADTIYADLTLRPTRVIAGANGRYDISVNSNITVGDMRPLVITNKPMTINGAVAWSPKSPMEVGLNDVNITIDDIPATFSTLIDFTDDLTVKSGDATIGPASFNSLLRFIDTDEYPQLNDLNTNMSLTITGQLTKPYVMATGDTLELPDIKGSIEVPECHLAYDHFEFNDVALSADYLLDGCDLDESTFQVKKFQANGRAISTTFSGSVSTPVSDPRLDGKLTLKVTLNRLPKALLNQYGAQASGNVTLESAAKFNISDISPKTFYRADLKGRLTLSNLNVEIPDSGLLLYTRKAVFGLGTHTSFKGAENRVDSLLRASLSIDTIAVTYAGMNLTAAEIKGGFGCENRPPSADTTVVIPMGAGLRVKSLAIVSSDSMKMRMRDAAISGRIQRYEGNRNAPLLSLTASAESLFATDGVNFAGLRQGKISADAHVRTRKQVADSLKQRRMANQRRAIPVDTTNTIELLDKSMVGLMNRWNMTGKVEAAHGMFFTPAMPIRNHLCDLDMTFSTDSIRLNSLKYTAGHSDFSVTGTITNLRRAVNRRGDITVKCAVVSDTLDVDELLHVAALGSDYLAGQDIETTNLTIDNIDALPETTIDTETPLSAILVPTNVDADLDLSAKHVRYSQLPVRDFNGCLLMKNGAINLHELTAESDLGGVSMSALYSAPRKDNIRFGLGLQLKHINVSQFIDLMPAIDSIMPLLKSFKGIINADIAATTDLDSLMDIKLPTLDAAVKLSGDSLKLLDAETFRTMKKWLRFKGSEENQIEHMEVEMLINNSMMEIFPFVFNFDRYRLAVMGSNDLALNYNYHVSVLKSPLPLKFGLNVSGNPDKMKVRLGKAKYKEGMAGQSVALVDTTRINLLAEMQRVFRAGNSRRRLGLSVNRAKAAELIDTTSTNFSHADSILMINEGLIERPDTTAVTTQSKKSKKK